ncbi:hypothetical protein C8Q76DRAFT_293085 [Earliella scabrosa]|nr:hypothetical protein C8Q76DRAFT_293085 [Earliella scabrosa]
MDPVTQTSIHGTGKLPHTTILSLPVEILHKILAYIPSTTLVNPSELSYFPMWNSFIVDTTMLVPFTITCRYFHDVALSRHSLWNSLVLRGGGKQQKQNITNWLRRSAALALDAVLYLGPASEAVSGGADMMDLWPSVAPRLRELHIVQQRDVREDRWNNTFHTACPLLESLTYDGNYCDTSPEIFPPLDSSRLRRLSLVCTRWAFPACHLPSLTHLALCSLTIPGIAMIRVLSQCPTLESLVCHNVHTSSEEDNLTRQADVQLPLPFLRRVILAMMEADLLSVCLAVLPRHPQGHSWHIIIPDNTNLLMQRVWEPSPCPNSQQILSRHSTSDSARSTRDAPGQREEGWSARS